MGSKAIASSGMTDETVALREQIARTRMEMTQTIEQLETRLDPELLKEQAKAKAMELAGEAKAKALDLTEQAKTAAYDATIGKAKTMVSRTTNGIVDTIKANPVPVALTALGIGWLIVSARAPQAQARVVNALGDKTDDLKQQATELAHTAQAKVGNVAETVQAKVGDVAETVQTTVRDVAHEAQVRGQRMETMAVQRFNDNPLAIGLGVAAVGLLIGLAIPTSQKENEILGAARDKLAHQAIGKVDELAHQALDKTKEQLGGGDHQNEPAQQGNDLQPTLPQT
jgi:ElaB/YqjD/DUF883 family membrane-anchored ribosome-binding protein